MGWSEQQILALAPDAASVKAGRAQAKTSHWPEFGSSECALWGSCQGSGKVPYQVCVELAEPAFRCSCPSRKFPCKHAIGLLLMWSTGAVNDAAEPDWVRTWLTERAARAERTAQRAEQASTRDPVAAQRRQNRRVERVAAGAAELRDWLADQVQQGLSGLQRNGPAALDAVARRMVDAQAPGLAGALQHAARLIGRGRDWPSQLLEELALLHLLVSAQATLGELPERLAETVCGRLGFAVDTADVLATGERIADTWLVLGHIDEIGDRLVSRRVWLRGTRTGRSAMVLSFAAPGRPLDGSLLPGTVVPASLARYPGAGVLRAAVAERSDACPAARPAGESIREALAGYAAAVAEDPWLDRWPVVLADVTPSAYSDGWALVGADGALPLRAGADASSLLAVSAGRPLTVSAEWSPGGLHPLGCWDGDRPVVL